MKTYAFCPISDKRIDERVVRINATLTFAFILLFVFTSSTWLLAILAVDFFLRSSQFSKYSFIGYMSRQMAKFLSSKMNFINAGPKIFAARVGLVFSLMIVTTSFLGFELLALGIALVLGTFSFLESAFGFCVACKIYPFIHKILYRE
jgi:hypothetical protein